MPLRRIRYLFNSLLGEVLLWVLTLLLFLWGLNVVLTYQVADKIADQPYDEQLANKVRVLADALRVKDGRVWLALPAASADVLRKDAKDEIYYAVSRLDGPPIAGDADIPWVESPRGIEPGAIGYYDAEYHGEDVRVAFDLVALPGTGGTALVQVAETRRKRTGLAGGIVSGVIVPQFLIVPIAVLFIYLGFTRGITPMQRLQAELRERSPTELSPINLQGIPEEVRPLIEALNGVMARLENSLGAQRRFIADAAHQLKTPLTGLRSQTELALRETNPQQLRESLRRIAAGAESLSHLTQQLLSLARAEAGAAGNGLERVDLAELARTATAEWADQALAKGIDVGYESGAADVFVMGHALLLHESLSDLIDNAIKYTLRGGQVTVRAYADDLARVEVEDTGIGIPLAERERIFERFYRVLGTEVDGSGLGLAIVKETVEQFHGTVEILDRPDGPGSLFRLSFPRTAG